MAKRFLLSERSSDTHLQQTYLHALFHNELYKDLSLYMFNCNLQAYVMENIAGFIYVTKINGIL